MTLAQLAAALGGEPHGPSDLALTGPGGFDHARAGEVVLAFDAAAAAIADAGEAAAVVVPTGVTSTKPHIVVGNPRVAVVKLAHAFEPPRPAPAGVHPTAIVDPTAQLGPDITVGPFAVIERDVVIGADCRIGPHSVIQEGTRIGDGCTLHPQVIIYPNMELGDRVIIHSGTVIGADGFGYRQDSGRHVRIPHVGRVEVGNDVEIGVCTAVDRAVLGSTRIGEGCKIDNFVVVAHNVKLGQHCLIVSHVGIAGSSEVGDYVVMAGQVGIADHVKIGNGVTLAAQSGIMRDVPDGATMAGTPALHQVDWFRGIAALKRANDLAKRLVRVEKKLGLHNQPGQHDDAEG